MTKPTDPTNEPYYEGKTFHQYTMELAIEMTGDPAANPITAFEQWKHEREALAELYNENEGLKILNRRLLLTLTLAEKAIDHAEDAVIFISERGRSAIEKFKEQVKAIQNSIAYSKEINHA
jgi:hypothetical protein